MPGSSLWLLPPADHPLNIILTTLIDKTSTHFSSAHRFLPHVTLTSDIAPATYEPDPQAWLDSLSLPTGSDVRVGFEKLNSEDVFTRKLYIKCSKTDGVKNLGQRCRQQVKGFENEGEARKWAGEQYNPHLSLLYHNCAPVNAEGLSKVEKFAQDLDVDVHGNGELGGWKGGRLVLVPTDKPINQWNAIAERSL